MEHGKVVAVISCVVDHADRSAIAEFLAQRRGQLYKFHHCPFRRFSRQVLIFRFLCYRFLPLVRCFLGRFFSFVSLSADEECELSSAHLPSTYPSSAPHPCLLLLEKGDRSAVDEECAFFPTDLSSSHLCLLLPVAKRHEGTEFHSGGVKEPECARAAARQGDRSAVDEECSSFPLLLLTPAT